MFQMGWLGKFVALTTLAVYAGERSSKAEVQLNTDGVSLLREMFFEHFEHVGWVELRSPT